MKKVVISPGRLRAIVEVNEGYPAFTDENIARMAVAAYPTLPQHSCINSAGPTFGNVISRTSLPHLLEHLAIEEMVDASAKASPQQSVSTFVGTTEWTDREHRLAAVDLSFADDLAAVASLRRALDFVNSIVSPA